jgi:hypothetical protein
VKNESLFRFVDKRRNMPDINWLLDIFDMALLTQFFDQFTKAASHSSLLLNLLVTAYPPFR